MTRPFIMARWLEVFVIATLAISGLALSFAIFEITDEWQGPAIVLVITLVLVMAVGFSYREAIRAQRQSGERFRAVIDNAHDAIIAIDTQGRVEMFNRAAERIFGYAAAEVIGRNVNMLMPQPYHGEHDGYLRNYITTGKAKIIGTGREVEARHKDGTVFPIDLSIGEMRSSGQRGFIGVIRDTTERHHSARQVRELTAELVHISRLSAMGELSSSLAHELNQPLTAIMNYTEAARQMLEISGLAVPSRVSEFLGKTVSQAERAGQIIRRLRNFVEKGTAERGQEELNRIIIEASNLATVGARIDGIKVQFDLDETLPPISIDKVQIQQVVVNLVRNAVEVLRDAERRELLIQTSGYHGGQEVAVRDTGPGIAPGIADKLFTAFVSTKKDGMGIGLSISRSIIAAHNGHLWAEPNPGGGSIFKFRLPAHVSGDAVNE